MNRRELKFIQSIQEYPSVSILMPTHRQHPKNQQDPIRLKNLIKEAENRLLGELSRNDVKPLLDKLNDIYEEIDFQHALDGLAVFVSKNHSFKFVFQFPVKERVLIDKTFATRDLVFAENRSQPYYVLILSDKFSKVYTGVRDNLADVNYNGFPVYNKFLKMIENASIQHTNDHLEPNVEKERNYFREVDKELKKLNSQDSYPVALAGVERNITIFNEVTTQSESIIASVKGSYDRTSVSDLAKIIWPEVKKGLARRREEVLKELDEAIGVNKYTAGIDEVWKLAHQGRASKLIVEINYHYPAKLDPNGLQLIPAEVISGPDVLDDAVDEVIEMVINKGGKVFFVDNGTLERFDRIAMILRY